VKSLQVKLATTKEEYLWCREIRRTVFIEEQGVPESIEIDEFENGSKHFLVLLDGQPVGAGRFRLKKFYAKFERIATLKSHRGLGIGRKLMETMQAHSSQFYPNFLPAMHAQKSAVNFYLKLGWVAVGEEFFEANIPHQILIYPQEILKRAQNESHAC
jgi:predicted GNAT family N-acyltransferase